MNIQVEIPVDEIVTLCKRYPVRSLALFGSVPREDFHPDSDIDMKVIEAAQVLFER
jgi:uncharacterized protein